jgi:hypothetical protein
MQNTCQIQVQHETNQQRILEQVNGISRVQGIAFWNYFRLYGAYLATRH